MKKKRTALDRSRAWFRARLEAERARFLSRFADQDAKIIDLRLINARVQRLYEHARDIAEPLRSANYRLSHYQQAHLERCQELQVEIEKLKKELRLYRRPDDAEDVELQVMWH